ncbi:ABC transporter ATP-binding protein [Streptococcus parauberis]|uniref:ABC transporter ATP-binding protein n=1 Tax=Streptococcus parauberis TaxID=1348 RepID=UPI000789B940|nr:ABC transporter ATP-binding protein [Streptococcus parauberis]KYP17094.1 Bacitracin export ATP-binding protein BceA [Streptococcus parauberis]KYP17270.1 Bacitracin export ATP-binding protein BceA [Streptococcus parauberis]KYP17327.1 Bacitracin export ATP-binding protein BceA [Streptococcus parauberis]KYP23962.1 Bacitracin export ATP-binding protein BceA [Streptococcus parauberis]KYP25549.1 Bacitracin export ATP-binding protein BceA [Streptococcus parauberis]
MSVLELKGINKSFQDGEQKHQILDNLDLTVNPGEFVAILGPSGSGKSTLLSIAGLLLSADSGQVKLTDQELSHLKQSQWTEKRNQLLGFIFQDHQLLPFMSIKEQLALVAGIKDSRPKKEVEAEIKSLLEELDILACQDKRPNKMSGGQKQRAAIARAFVGNPQLILADEPTASLDAKRGREITELIKKEVKAKNKAAVMVTHDQRILDLVDTIYELKDGKLEKVS